MRIDGIWNRRLTCAFALVVLAALSARPAAAAVGYLITVDTSSVSGTSGFLDFQFNPGSASTQSATAQILNFTSDGILVGVPQINGNVAGVLPGTTTFMNSSALNEYFQQFTYGAKVSFVVLLSGPALDSPNGTATSGSSFGVGLYDSAQNPILTNQGAASGFVAEIDVNLDGTTTPTAFPNVNGGPSVASTSPFSPVSPDFLQVRYAANLNSGDSVVDITNTGTSGASLCANVYTFDPAEELISCCTCSVTPNGLQSLSVRNSLLSNTLTAAIPTSAVIKIVASTGTCNASAVDAAALASGLRAWGTTIHPLPTSPASYGVTETPFSFASLSPAELAHLTQFCGFIQADASGFGICKGCAAGGLGATPSAK
jgi:hypothetical protein